MGPHVFTIGGAAPSATPFERISDAGFLCPKPQPEDGGSFNGKQASASFQWS